MRKRWFLHIIDSLESRYELFQLWSDALERRGLLPLTKCTAAMQMLAYAISADHVDECLKISESMAMECTKKLHRRNH